MTKSIIQPFGHSCFLCGKNGAQDRLERHHVYGGANRGKSEEDGLWVWLCGNECHRNGKDAAHRNRDTMDRLHRAGELAYLETYNKTKEDFSSRYGRNYL